MNKNMNAYVCACVLVFLFVFCAFIVVPIYLAQHPQGVCVKVGTDITVRKYYEWSIQNVPATTHAPSKPLDIAAV